MIGPPYFFRMDFNSNMFILQRGTEYLKPKLFNRNAYLLSPPIFAATGNCLRELEKTIKPEIKQLTIFPLMIGFFR